MPGLSGQVLAERLLMKQPNLKVLFMTGYSEDMIYNYSSGAASINLLQKPYKYEELVSRVQDILGEDKGISQRNNF
jgi:FixJ family two-component response regulator